MNASGDFAMWLTCGAGIPTTAVESLRLVGAFEVLASRCAAAREAGSQDPLRTISPKWAGGNSRQCTRSMLRQLGYSPRELRIVHRLMGGSTGGWPGLIPIFVHGRTLSEPQVSYVRRQIRLCGRRAREASAPRG